MYAAWTDRDGLWLACSRDRGESWASWSLVKGEEPAYFPYLVARGNGELAVSWFTGRAATLRLQIAKIIVPAQGAPRLLRAQPIETDSWHNLMRALRNPAGEYVAIALLRDGSIGVPAPIYNPQEKRFGFTWWRFEAPPGFFKPDI